MRQTITEHEKVERRRKISAHNIIPSHNGPVSHVVGFAITLGLLIYSSNNSKENRESFVKEKLLYVVHFGHLLVFATWVGIQVWVHVSGFTMFKTLTRNAFAQVQSKIFPMYFMSGIIMSAISLVTHLFMYPEESWKNDSFYLYQAISISISLLCSLVNYFYLGPETIRMMLIKAHRVTFLGIKDGVGPIAPKLVEHDLTYKEMKEKFIKMHAACSMINVICFGACGVNVWCLACKQILC